MNSFIELINNNKEWLFSGVGITIITILTGGIVVLIKKYFFLKNEKINRSDKNNNIQPSTTITKQINEKTLEDYKNETKVLFIDDQHFPIVNIIKTAGWVHTKRLKDCKSLDMPEIVEANILFIDIHGVGKEMKFHDEGLGLALALKERYSSKKIIIYSVERHGDRFHKALTKVDFFLAKNSDSYEFQKLIEEYTIGSH